MRVDEGEAVGLELDGRLVAPSELDARVIADGVPLLDDTDLTLSVRTTRGWSQLGQLRVEDGRVRRQSLFPGTYRLFGPRGHGRAECDLAPASTFRHDLSLQPR